MTRASPFSIPSSFPLGATAVTMIRGRAGAYALSRMAFRGRNSYLNWVLGQRFMPPIAIIVPLVTIYAGFGMRDNQNSLSSAMSASS